MTNGGAHREDRMGGMTVGRGLTVGVSGERSAAERVHCTPGLDAGDECGLQLFIASVADDCAVVRDLP